MNRNKRINPKISVLKELYDWYYKEQGLFPSQMQKLVCAMFRNSQQPSGKKPYNKKRVPAEIQVGFLKSLKALNAKEIKAIMIGMGILQPEIPDATNKDDSKPDTTTNDNK